MAYNSTAAQVTVRSGPRYLGHQRTQVSLQQTDMVSLSYTKLTEVPCNLEGKATDPPPSCIGINKPPFPDATLKVTNSSTPIPLLRNFDRRRQIPQCLPIIYIYGHSQGRNMLKRIVACSPDEVPDLPRYPYEHQCFPYSQGGGTSPLTIILTSIKTTRTQVYAYTHAQKAAKSAREAPIPQPSIGNQAVTSQEKRPTETGILPPKNDTVACI